MHKYVNKQALLFSLKGKIHRMFTKIPWGANDSLHGISKKSVVHRRDIPHALAPDGDIVSFG